MDTNRTNRREFLKKLGAITAGIILAPYVTFGEKLPETSAVLVPEKLMKRKFGKINFHVTTMGLGGQASLQWTPPDIDPVKIIEKAFSLGINYYDTSNVYGPSQLNYGKAFRNLHLIPGQPDYNKKLRESIFLTAKTHIRFGKGNINYTNVRSKSDSGDISGGCIADLKRSLSQIFGDGDGNYPEGAYVNMFLMHNIVFTEEVDVLYNGYENPSPDLEEIGAIAALVDYRDGTNITGLNPKKEKLIRHIGFSGHRNAYVMIDMIQRDTKNILEAVLMPVNSNDFLATNMQYNVIPVARAKNMGVISMKVFANGRMYDLKNYGEIVRGVKNDVIKSSTLVSYSVSTPGVHLAIIGIGEINDDPSKCQLVSNLSAAQVEWGHYSRDQRKSIESITSKIRDGKTNDFQLGSNKLTAPSKPAIQRNGNKVTLSWHTAYAGAEALKCYEIYRDNLLIAKVQHTPQVDKTPFTYIDNLKSNKTAAYKIVTVDVLGTKAESEIFTA